MRRLLSIVSCALLLGACPPTKKTTKPTSLPGLRVTSGEVCELLYEVSVEGGAAKVRLSDEKSREIKVVGKIVGEAVLFFGADLFTAPRSCTEAQIEIEVSASPRYQVSSSLMRDEFVYRASSVTEAQQSLWVIGRETELRMLEGSFTAVFIGGAQERTTDVTSLVSSMEELFGAPLSRQLLVIGAANVSTKSGRSVLLDHTARDFSVRLTRAVVSLWLTSGASTYYQLWLRMKWGEISTGSFVAALQKDTSAARFFCLDVLSRAKGGSLPEALREKMLAREAMSERAVAEALQISACMGDGLKVAGPSAGMTVSKKEVKLTKPAALLSAVGL